MDMIYSAHLITVVRYSLHSSERVGIFSVYADLFDTASDNINVISEVSDDSEYGLFITDLSSYVFNFVYLKRSIIYYLPDSEEYKGGMNSYSELLVPMEDGFGKLVSDPGSLIREIKRIVKNDFIPDEKYLKKMDGFFLPDIYIEHCCDKLYNEMINK